MGTDLERGAGARYSWPSRRSGVQDERFHGVDVQLARRVEGHPRSGTALAHHVRSYEQVGRKAAGGGLADEIAHHAAVEAGSAGDLDPALAQLLHRFRYAGNHVAVPCQHFHLQRRKLYVKFFQGLPRRFRAVGRFPSLADRWIGEQRPDVILLVGSHRSAGLGLGDPDAVAGEQLHEGHDRPAAAVVQGRARKIENHGTHAMACSLIHGFSKESYGMTATRGGRWCSA